MEPTESMPRGVPPPPAGEPVRPGEFNARMYPAALGFAVMLSLAVIGGVGFHVCEGHRRVRNAESHLIRERAEREAVLEDLRAQVRTRREAAAGLAARTMAVIGTERAEVNRVAALLPALQESVLAASAARRRAGLARAILLRRETQLIGAVDSLRRIARITGDEAARLREETGQQDAVLAELRAAVATERGR